MLRVYLSRADIPSPESKPLVMVEAPKICVASSGYYALITTIIILVSIVIAMLIAAFFVFKQSKRLSVSENYNYDRLKSLILIKTLLLELIKNLVKSFGKFKWFISTLF